MISALPLPEIDNHNKEYWAGCLRGELLGQSCAQCGRLRFPPRPMCPHCNSMKTDWVPLSGKGKVISWIICHPPVLPAFTELAPYNVILVELEEGLRMVSNLVDHPNDKIEQGMNVEVVFEQVADDVSLPKFRPTK